MLLLGLMTACGPTSAPQGDTGSDDGTSTTGASSPTDPSSPTNPSEPTTTDPSSPSDPSSPTVGTDPMPECQTHDDCGAQYCGYCSEGQCVEGTGCCGNLVTPPHAKGWRCGPMPECYSDADCEYTYACEFDLCVPITFVPVPPCGPQELITSEWNLSQSPGAFVLADLDGDLDLDLAAAQPTAAQIEVALNDGAGDFVLAGAFPVGAPTGTLALAAGDFDLDGHQDLVVARRDDSTITLLFGQDAVFTPGEVLLTPGVIDQVFVADIDGDGAPDLVTLGVEDPQVTIWRGDGKGGTADVRTISLGSLAGPRASLVDVTEEGRVDLLAPVPGGPAAGVWSGEVGRDFDAVRFFEEKAAPLAVFGADLDTHLDPQAFAEIIAVRPTQGGGAATVWRGVSAGAWSEVPTIFTGVSALHGGVIVKNEAPARHDLVAATGQPSVAVWQGDANGGFGCERVLPVPGSTTPALIAAGDVDGDARPDIVVGAVDSGTITVLRPK